jgi:hypothetical protein
LTEATKILADPDVSDRRSFEENRRLVIDKACMAYESYVSETGPDVGFLIHIGLLRTISGERDLVLKAYREAVEQSETRVKTHPRDVAAWADLAGSSAHFGLHLWAEGNHEEALPLLKHASHALKRALRLERNGVWLNQPAAWFLSFNPIADHSDRLLALELAHRINETVTIDEGNRRDFSAGLRALFTLGLAEYRLDNLDEAEKSVLRSMNFRDGGDAYEMFLRAMILSKRRDPSAHEWFARADEWMRRNRYGDFELHLLRQEAMGLLPSH